jgi:hypothetical protein
MKIKPPRETEMNKKFQVVLTIMCTFCLYRAPFASSSTFTGHFTYTITNKKTNPSADEADAYAKITLGMDSAVWFYNTYTTLTKKLTVEYKPDVQTADGSYSGNIRFGSNRTYMKGCTCMHEIAHTTGVGTTTEWSKLIVNKAFTGKNATKKLKEILGSQDSVLHGDTQHFWPFGLNYDYEAKSQNDLINHCLIVNSIQKDIFPTQVGSDNIEKPIDNFSMTMNSVNNFTYTVPIADFVTICVYAVSGQKVAAMQQGYVPAGTHCLVLQNLNLPKGNYVFQLNAGQIRQARLISILNN